MKYESSVEYQLQQRQFAYAAVIDALHLQAHSRRLSPEELGMLGTSQFRLSLFEDAEENLTAAKNGGNVEAEIELQGCRLALLKFDEARDSLEELVQRTQGQGFLHSMALRWAGVTETLLGNARYGAGLLSQAYREFQSVGNERGMQITANMLGAALILRGDYDRAEFYLKRSLKLSRPDVEQAIWVDTGIKLFMLYAYTDRPAEAKDAIGLMRQTIVNVSQQAKSTGYFNTQIRLCETILARLQNKRVPFVTSLLALHPLLLDNRQRHVEALIWLGPLLLDSISRQLGQHSVALSIIQRVLPDRRNRPLPIRVVEGIILLRRGGYVQAVDNLEQTLEAALAADQRLDVIRCQLYLADALYKSGRAKDAVPHLKRALQGLTTFKPNFFLQDDLDAVQSVLLYATAEPETAHLLQIVRGKAPAPLARTLQLQTFGRLGLQEAGAVRKWALDDQNLLLILVYLKMRPGHTVDDIARDVLTEKYLESPDSAYSYVRRAIMLLRNEFGKEFIVSRQDRKAGPARYSVTDEIGVVLDVDAAYDALADGDLEKFFTVYQGRFAARLECDFATAINDEIEGAVYQYLATLAQSAESLGELHQLERWARLLISVAPENEFAVQLSENIDAAILETEGRAMGIPLNH